MISIKKLFSTVCLISFLILPLAQAQFTLSETSDVVKKGDYYIGLTPQLKLSDGSGGNFNLNLDMPLREDISWRGFVGGGDVDFFGGAAAKWSPFPDYGKQPGVAFRAGLTFGRELTESFTVYRVDPIVSKKYETEYGFVTPYGSLPVSWTNINSQSRTQLGLVAGAEYQSEDSQNLKFNLEVGLNLKDSFSYLAGSVIYQLDQKKGLKLLK